MTIEQKLRGASAALKEATAEAVYTATVPGSNRRSRFAGPLVAALAASAVIILIALPLLFFSGDPNAGTDVGSRAGTAPESSEPVVESDSSPTTVLRAETTVTQQQTDVGNNAYLSPNVPGWTLTQGTVRDSESASMTLTDGTTEVVLELNFGTGIDGAWRTDFMRELEIAGVREQTQLTVRGKEAVLWVSESGMPALEWIESPGTLVHLITLSGPNPEPMIQLAEQLKPMSEDDWAAMIVSFNGVDESGDTTEDIVGDIQSDPGP